MINKKICIEINYTLDFSQIPLNILTYNINKDLEKIINEYAIEENGILLLINVQKLDNKKNIDIFKLKKAITYLSIHYFKYIDKCVFFNVFPLFKPIITLIKFTLGDKYKNKIIIKEDLVKILKNKNLL